MFTSKLGQLVLQSFDSCVMWPVPEETVLQYEIHYNNITKVQNYTTNWYCLQDEIHNAVNITVGTCALNLQHTFELHNSRVLYFTA